MRKLEKHMIDKRQRLFLPRLSTMLDKKYYYDISREKERLLQIENPFYPEKWLADI